MPLTVEQEEALTELMRRVPVRASTPPAAPGFLETWLGVSSVDLRGTLQGLLHAKDRYQARLLDWIEQNPLDANGEFMLGVAWLFYQAEHGVNSRIQTYVDAVYYIATCASVGYADIFAVTQAGRAIAALVMTVGPALTNKALDRPRTPVRADSSLA